MGWTTNDPGAAKALKAADRAYEAECRRIAAVSLDRRWGVADKLEALQAARIERARAYAAVAEGAGL